MQQSTAECLPAGAPADFLPLNGTSYLEFWVGNAKQAAFYYRAAFGMELIAYRGPETGCRDRVSWVVRQGKICFVLTSALSGAHEISEHVRRHGDGIRDVALSVDDAQSAWLAATSRGARSVDAPHTVQNDCGEMRLASIAAYGDVIHSFVERRDYTGAFMPGYRDCLLPDPLARYAGLFRVDHTVGNVGWGDMNRWVDFYRDVMGFRLYQHFDDKEISTEYSSLMSKVMANGDGRVKFLVNEPARGRRKSQIEEYLDYYGGPGVQHLAMETHDILHTVGLLRDRGVEFIGTPATYYENLRARVGPIDESFEDLERFGILADRDEEGYLLQIFTKPVTDRPTLFFEIIQRKGSRGFGKGNIKALFEAIEREQAARGNL
ncbi:MAG: 4-hydroxyphenylpyruvate dioxygenase [Acidobacteriota bacterium]